MRFGIDRCWCWSAERRHAVANWNSRAAIFALGSESPYRLNSQFSNLKILKKHVRKQTCRIPDCTRLRILGTVLKSENDTVQQYDLQTGPKIAPFNLGTWGQKFPSRHCVRQYVFELLGTARTSTLLWYTQTYAIRYSDPGGSARGRARARGEHPTWAYRVRYRELGRIGMFRRKSLLAPRKIPVKHTDRLEELTDLHLLSSPLSPAEFGPTNSYIQY
jgi:hypothetical protein